MYIHIKRKPLGLAPCHRCQREGFGWNKKKKHGLQKKNKWVMNLHSEHSKTKNKNARVVFKCQRNPQMTRNRGEQFKTGKVKKGRNHTWTKRIRSNGSSNSPQLALLSVSFLPCWLCSRSPYIQPPCFYLLQQAITSSTVHHSANPSSSPTTMASHPLLLRVPCSCFHAWGGPPSLL